MKLVIGLLISFVCSSALAGICTTQLQEEANVFEVNCLLDLTQCFVTGYFTHPRLSPGYGGLVASLAKPPKKDSERQPILVIYTYRNGTPKVETPPGYWAAIQAAEKTLIGELPSALRYYDATTGKVVGRPEMECVSVSKPNK